MNQSDVLRLARLREAVAAGTAKKLRVSAKLSLSETACFCKVDQSTVWRWENGRRTPRGPGALRYARLLESLGQGEQVSA
jgi:transcriptional regulator with XRE-family HTH domain